MTANPPDSTIPAGYHSRRRRLIRGLVIGLCLGTVTMVVLISILASRDSVEWTAPVDLTRPPPRRLPGLRDRLGRLASPVVNYFHRTRPLVKINSTILVLPAKDLDPMNLGAPLTINPDGMRAWILSPASFSKLKSYLGTNGSSAVSRGIGLPVGDGRFTQTFALDPRKPHPLPVGLVVDMISRSAFNTVKLTVEVTLTEPVAALPGQTERIRTNLSTGCLISIPNDGAVVMDSGRARDLEGNVYWMVISPELLDSQGKPLRR